MGGPLITSNEDKNDDISLLGSLEPEVLGEIAPTAPSQHP